MPFGPTTITVMRNAGQGTQDKITAKEIAAGSRVYHPHSIFRQLQNSGGHFAYSMDPAVTAEYYYVQAGFSKSESQFWIIL